MTGCEAGIGTVMLVNWAGPGPTQLLRRKGKTIVDSIRVLTKWGGKRLGPAPLPSSVSPGRHQVVRLTSRGFEADIVTVMLINWARPSPGFRPLCAQVDIVTVMLQRYLAHEKHPPP